jgi:hypothetical protein
VAEDRAGTGTTDVGRADGPADTGRHGDQPVDHVAARSAVAHYRTANGRIGCTGAPWVDPVEGAAGCVPCLDIARRTREGMNV